MAVVHQSQLASLARCMAQEGYRRAGLPDQTNSAAAYGSVVHHCFAGEVEFMTPDGPMTFAKAAGSTQQVLTRGLGAAMWVEAPISALGMQPLQTITVQRGHRVKEIRATPEHRWFVCTRANRASELREVRTSNLQPGDRLAWQFPRSATGRSTPMPTAVGAGIVFGDGTREAHQSRVDLWGVKRDLLKFFAAPAVSPLVATANGVEGFSVRNLPLSFKDRPGLDAGVPYLYGWLAGWLATDGCVLGSQVTLSCANRDHLEFARAIATRLGIATNPIAERAAGASAYTDAPSYVLTFVNATMPPEMLVRSDHHEAFIRRDRGSYRGWRVVDVADPSSPEPVFCATVQGTEAFVLEDWIYTGNSILQVLEPQLKQGVPFETALKAALDTFAFYWVPANIEAICEPVPADGWLPKQSYAELRQRGLDTIRKYADLIRYDDNELLATEFGFMVPIDGTVDLHTGEPHWLAGSVDRLAVRHYSRMETVCLDDDKTGVQPEHLRYHQQFTAYAFASLQREFWVGARGEDGFGEQRGQQLFDRFQGAGRRGTWIDLRTIKFVDAGWRGPVDYERFRLAVQQYFALIDADIFPLSISGANCKYCNFRRVCGGIGLPDDEHGRPGR